MSSGPLVFPSASRCARTAAVAQTATTSPARRTRNRRSLPRRPAVPSVPGGRIHAGRISCRPRRWTAGPAGQGMKPRCTPGFLSTRTIWSARDDYGPRRGRRWCIHSRMFAGIRSDPEPSRTAYGRTAPAGCGTMRAATRAVQCRHCWGSGAPKFRTGTLQITLRRTRTSGPALRLRPSSCLPLGRRASCRRASPWARFPSLPRCGTMSDPSEAPTERPVREAHRRGPWRVRNPRGGPGTRSKLVKFQVRPDPLASQRVR